MTNEELKQFIKSRSIENHQRMRDQGFWDKPMNFGEKIALMHDELSEAWSGRNLESDKLPGFWSVSEEIADVAIRDFDYLGSNESLLKYVIEEINIKEEDRKVLTKERFPIFALHAHSKLSKILDTVRKGNPMKDEGDAWCYLFEFIFEKAFLLEPWSPRRGDNDPDRLTEIIDLKMEYNTKRPKRHGKQF